MWWAVLLVSVVGLAASMLVVARLAQLHLASTVTHICVAVAFLPLSAILSFVLPLAYNTAVETVQGFARGAPGLAVIATHLHPLYPDSSLLDVQAIACLLLCEYGFMVIGSHLVDITRYLKISRRRLRSHHMIKAAGAPSPQQSGSGDRSASFSGRKTA